MPKVKTKSGAKKRFKLTGIFSTPAYLETLTTEIEGMGLDPAPVIARTKVHEMDAWVHSQLRVGHHHHFGAGQGPVLSTYS